MGKATTKTAGIEAGWTREDLEAAMGRYAKAAIERSQTALAMEQELALVRGRYERRMAEQDGLIEGCFAALEAWAALHPEEFAERRTLELTHGTLGLRTGTPALKCVKGVKWEHVLERIKQSGLGHVYTRVAEDVDKAKLIADRETLGDERLRTFGVRIEQAERFFAEPRLDPATQEGGAA